ncbi:unnamed protein product [Trichobilharzia szidati]|nr:unnamed protein product [Trichobilharzia szidati]
MDFQEMIAADLNSLQSKVTNLFRTSRNQVPLAFLQDLCILLNSFQHEYQSVLKQFELGLINLLVVRNVHKSSHDVKIGSWIEEVNDFVNKFENSKPTGANSHDAKYRFQYSTLIEALDLHRDCYQSSYCPMPINEKCLSIQNLQYIHYTDKINQDIQTTWNLLCDCYWLVLVSKLSELNAYLPNINSEWTEKNVTLDIQSPHCYTITRRCKRLVYNLLQQLSSYPSELSIFNSNNNHNNNYSNRNGVGDQCLLKKYTPMTLDCFCEMDNNLSVMIKYAKDKSIIDKLLPTTGKVEEYSKSLYSVFTRMDSLFRRINFMRYENCALFPKMHLFNYSSPVTYRTVLTVPSVGVKKSRRLNEVVSDEQKNDQRVYDHQNHNYYAKCGWITSTRCNYYSELVIKTHDNYTRSSVEASAGLSCLNEGEQITRTGNNDETGTDEFARMDENQVCEEDFHYKTCAYFSRLQQHIVPIYLANENTRLVDDDITMVSDTFSIYQGNGDDSEKSHSDSAYHTSSSNNLNSNNDSNDTIDVKRHWDKEYSTRDSQDTFETTSELSSFNHTKSSLPVNYYCKLTTDDTEKLSSFTEITSDNNLSKWSDQFDCESSNVISCNESDNMLQSDSMGNFTSIKSDEIQPEDFIKRAYEFVSVGVELKERYEQLVECIDCHQPAIHQIDGELDTVSQNLASIASKLNDPDCDAHLAGTSLSTTGALVKQILELEEIEAEIRQTEENLCKIKSNPLFTTDSCQTEGIRKRLESTEGELTDMQLAIHNKLKHLREFHWRLDEFTESIKTQLVWMREQEGELERYTVRHNNESNELDEELNDFYMLIIKLNHYQRDSLMPMLNTYDKLTHNNFNPDDVEFCQDLQLIGPFYNAEDNVQLGRTVHTTWDNITKQLMPKVFHELITLSYEQFSRNLAPTIIHLLEIQSLDFLLPSEVGHLPKPFAIEDTMNFISDQINNIEGEMNWLRRHLGPIILSEDRCHLFASRDNNDSNINHNNNNGEIVVFDETVRGLGQLVNYCMTIYQNLQLECLPAVQTYHDTVNYAACYLKTVQGQIDVLLVPLAEENNIRQTIVSSRDVNEELTLVIYEKLETLRTGKDQCLQLLNTVQNNHRNIVDKLNNSIKQFQYSIHKLPMAKQDSSTAATTTPALYDIENMLKSVNSVELISENFMDFIKELTNMIDQYDEVITSLSQTNDEKAISALSLDRNVFDSLEEYTQESESLQNSTLPQDIIDCISEFDKNYERLLNSWSILPSSLNRFNEEHMEDETMAVGNGSLLPLIDSQQHDKVENNDYGVNHIGDGVQVMYRWFEELDHLEDNLKSSIGDVLHDNELFISRINKINKLRDDIKERFTVRLAVSEQFCFNHQLDKVLVEFHQLKKTFKQSALSLLQDIGVSENETYITSNIFRICVQSLRNKLSETKGLIGRLQDLADETNSVDFGINDFPSEVEEDFENKSTQDLMKLPYDSRKLCIPSISVPLWHGQVKINEVIVNFLEHIQNHHERLLLAYELAERLSTWISIMHPRVDKLKIRLQQCSIKPVNEVPIEDLNSHLHNITLFRLESCSQMSIIQCIVKDGDEFKNVILHLNEDYKWEDKTDGLQLEFLSLSSGNRCTKEASDVTASIIRLVNQKMETIMNDFVVSFDQSSILLEATRSRLIETGQIQTLLNDFSSILNESSICSAKILNHCQSEDENDNVGQQAEEKELCFSDEQHDLVSLSPNLPLNHSGKMEHLEIWCTELESVQGMLNVISSNPCIDTTNDKNLESQIKRLTIQTEQHCLDLSTKKAKLLNEVKQENQLLLSISAYSTWIGQLREELMKLGIPNHLNVDVAEAKWKEFKEWELTFQNESHKRLSSLIKQFPNSIFQSIFKRDKTSLTSIEDFVSDETNFNDYIIDISDKKSTSSSSVTTKRIKSRLELSISRMLRQYAGCRRQCSIFNKLWMKHINYVKHHAQSLNKIHLLFEGIQAELSKLYRPSKLVSCCTEQLNSVKNVIDQLKEYEVLVVSLYDSLPLLKSVCSANEVSRAVATIKDTKHNFVCLLRRATERQKILTQALKEDTKFDTAYHSLMEWFLTNVELLKSYNAHPVYDEKIQMSIKTLLKEFNQRQSDYWLVMRMGGNLRERCTISDPEKDILTDMLDKLTTLKSEFASLLSTCQIEMQKSSLTARNKTSTISCLKEWLHSAEEQFGIENIHSGLQSIEHSSGNADTSITDSNANSNTEQPLSNGTDSSNEECNKQSMQPSNSMFSYQQYVNIVSVAGDLAFVQSVDSNHSILGEQLCQQEKLYQEIISNNVNTSESADLRERLIRIRKAYDLRCRSLQMAREIATDLTTNYTHLKSWLIEALHQISQQYEYGHNLNTNDDNNNNDNIQNKTILQIMLNITEKSSRQETKESSTTSRNLPYKSQLNLCFKLYTEQQQTYQSMFIELQRIMKKILLQNVNTEFKNDFRTTPDDRLDEISVYCHKDYRSQLIMQYKQIIHLWHKVDKGLQCLCVQLGHSLETFNTGIRLYELEQEENWIHSEMHRLDKYMISDRALVQSICKLFPSILDESISLSFTNDESLLMSETPDDLLSICYNSIGCATDTPDDRNLVEKVFQELEERIDLSREKLMQIKDKEERISICLKTYRSITESIVSADLINNESGKETFIVNTVPLPSAIPSTVESSPSNCTAFVNNHQLLNNRMYHDNNNNSNSNNADTCDDNNSTDSVTINHTDILTTTEQQTYCHRAEMLKNAYAILLRRTNQRIKQLEYYRDKILECTVLTDFDFDEWRRNYLQWIESCHYCLADIFPAITANTDTIQADQQKSKHHLHLSPTSSTLLTPRKVSTVSSSTQSTNSSPKHSSPPTPTTISIKSLGKKSSSESLSLCSNDVVVGVVADSNKTRAIVEGKQTANISKSPELNYSEFSEVLLLRRRQQHQQQQQHSRSKYDWANPLCIRAVFNTIDRTRKGRITHQQIIEALTAKKQQQQQQPQQHEQATKQQHLPNDELIARAVEQETSKCMCQIKFQSKKVGTDKYCFGPSSKIYLVRFLNSTTMVRVGGGWMKLSEFLDTRDPCRIVHKRNRLGSAAPKANSSLSTPLIGRTSTTSASKKENTLGFIEVTPIRGSNSQGKSPTVSKKELPITSTPLMNKEVKDAQEQVPSLIDQAMIDVSDTSSTCEQSSNEPAATMRTTKDRKNKTRKH